MTVSASCRVVFSPSTPGKGDEVILAVPAKDAKESTTAAAAADRDRPAKPGPIRKKKNARAEEDIPALFKVETSFGEWFTIDTLRFLRGDAHVREVLRRDLGLEESAIVSAVGDETFEPEFREKYIELCRRLDLQDVDSGGGVDKTATQENSAKSRELREESELEMLKMSSFLRGRTEYNAVGSEEKERNDDDDDGGSQGPNLPLVDRVAQVALRRRIVHEQLDRV